jgi:hypothetical protein
MMTLIVRSEDLSHRHLIKMVAGDSGRLPQKADLTPVPKNSVVTLALAASL